MMLYMRRGHFALQLYAADGHHFRRQLLRLLLPMPMAIFSPLMLMMAAAAFADNS